MYKSILIGTVAVAGVTAGGILLHNHLSRKAPIQRASNIALSEPNGLIAEPAEIQPTQAPSQSS